MSYAYDEPKRRIGWFEMVGIVLVILLVVTGILAYRDSQLDKGRCLASRHVKEYHYYTSKPPMWHTVPAHDVCDRWEFPKGRPTK